MDEEGLKCGNVLDVVPKILGNIVRIVVLIQNLGGFHLKRRRIKMRCYCCNNILKPSEAVRRFKESLAFTEMCNTCLGTISDDVETVEGQAEDEELFDDDGNPVEEE